MTRYWQTLDGNETAAQAAAPVSLGRRTFVEMMGLSAATVGLAGCRRAPVKKVIPYLAKPDEITPGTSIWYASACPGCDAQCGVLFKARDGRPIKVEGNPEHPWSRGAVCAVGQASVLSLYDAARARGPLSAGKPTTWAKLDAEVAAGLSAARTAGKQIYLVAPASAGPTQEAALRRFAQAWSARTVRFDPTGEASAVAEAHQSLYGARLLPALHLERAELVLSFACDFLGTWLAPAVFARQYAEARRLPLAPREEGKAPPPVRAFRHVQLEPALSLTGSNADDRALLAPSEIVPALAGLVRRLAARSAHPQAKAMLAALPLLPEPPVPLDSLAADLARAGRAGLVVCGLADPRAQALCIAANELIGATGNTVDPANGAAMPRGDLEFDDFLAALEAGLAGAVIFAGTNPVYAHPEGARLAAALASVDLTVSTADRPDETGAAVRHLAPDHSPAESWGDSEPRRGLLTLRQPALAPLFDTRAQVESLFAWAGAPAIALDTLRERLRTEAFPRARVPAASFEAFWRRGLQDGFIETAEAPLALRFDPAGLPKIAPEPAPELELWIYQKVALRDGRLGNNGWLHELPDPITKVTWDNYACLSPAHAARAGIRRDGRLVTLTAGGRSLTLPALVQPGTHDRVVAIARGYGRTGAGPLGNGVGVNIAPLSRSTAATLTVTADRRELARSQMETSQQDRELVREATLADFRSDAAAGNPPEEPLHSIWPGHASRGHRWGLAVDLSACTGCGACVVSCQAENNIPVVGREEVGRRREMHWMRIDRYYAGSPVNPRVVHQPVMCQHCANAPCETVCPVLATNHSPEGLNQQAYNRCVGTRYCANNCPPKVRRFNWFDYRHDDPLSRLVLNPDVVVRTRGVMEKCSLCVQRISEGKALAKREGRELRDGEIETACEQSCPARALVFGDLNDPKSRVFALARDARAYHLLFELNVGPAVSYLTRIKNPGAI